MSSQQEPWQSGSQLAQLRQSELSVMAFCRRVGIKHHRLYSARNKQERSLSQPTPKPAESLQVESMLRLLLSAQTPDSLARALCSVLVSAR
jgi:hypothetical protein